MKIEFETPKVERNVVITMTESEAKDITAILGKLNFPKVDNLLCDEIDYSNSDCTRKAYNTSYTFYRTFSNSLK